jgi:cellulose biosynthesis protein BcsQ
MSAKIISVINYKGGVGKTLSTYNIAFGLSFLNNHKVLIIDLDPQCSLSTICLRALSETRGTTINLTDLRPEQTINAVIKDYLNTDNPNIDLSSLIFKNFYTSRSTNKIFDRVDFIPATMYDTQIGNIEKGLDDLEIDIVRNYAYKVSNLELVTIFAKFFNDTKIDDEYDFILFDCPPANNIITQNALLISNYYLIPTIMDDISSNGVNHLINVIENSVYKSIYDNNKRNIDRCEAGSYLEYLKTAPKLLGIFETMRKTQVRYNYRKLIKQSYPDDLFNEIIYHHTATSTAISKGSSCFSIELKSVRSRYTPYYTYGNLVLSILKKIGVPINNTKTIYDWL